MTNFIVEPFSIATQGLLIKNSNQTYGFDPITISLNGLLVEIFEEIIPPTIQTEYTRQWGNGIYRRKKYSDKSKPVKLITVKCVVNGKEYIQSKEYKNLKVSIKDIGVEINTDQPNNPKIKIFIEK